jgi:GPH family glycoside/pentoside/hexuronide:cation symporter
MVPWLGGGDPKLGWQLTMLVWGVIAAGMFLVTFATTKERVAPPAKQKSDIRAELKDLLGNGPWLVMFLLGVLVITMFWIRGATTLYYFKYFVKDEDLFEWFMTLGTFSNIIGITATSFLTRIFGSKHRLYMVLMGASALLTTLFYFIPPDQIVVIFTLNIVINLILGPNAPLVWAMYADTADYGEWKSGRRATGLVFSAATFAQKLGGAVAGFIAGWSLTVTGYVANQDQTPEALQGILLLFSFVPAVIGVIAAGAVSLYKLDDKRMKEIEADLLKRRAELDEPAPA